MMAEPVSGESGVGWSDPTGPPPIPAPRGRSARTSAPPNDEPQSDPTRRPTRSAPAPRDRWWAKPPVLAAAGLLLLIVELAGYASGSVLWWAVGNVILVVVALVVALAWWRRERRRAAAGRDRSATGGPTQGGRGLFGRNKEGAGAQPGERRNPLARLFGSWKWPGRNKDAGSASPTGGPSGAGKGGGLHPSRPAGKGPLARWWDTLRGAGNNPGGGASGKPLMDGKADKAKAGDKATGGWRWPWRRGDKTPKPTVSGKPDEATKTEPAAKADNKPSDPPKPATAAAPVKVPRQPQHAPQRSTGMTITNDDSSLQRWGRDLGKIAPALGHVQKQRTQVTANDEAAAQALAKVAQQATNGEQPASPALAAELDAIAKEWKRLADEEAALDRRRRALVGRSEGLSKLYEREHETDEDRLRVPRNNLQAEMRADVSRAVQDT